MESWNSRWDALDPAQADGRVCVLCGDEFDYSAAKPQSHQVGRSYKDYDVFACTDCLPTVLLDWEAYKKNRKRPGGEATAS